MCAVKPSYDCRAAKRLFDMLKLLSLSNGRIGSRKQINERNIVLGGTILSVKQLLKKIGGKTFAWADDRFTNGIREDVEIFESAKNHLRIQKFPDACGRGVRRLTFVSSPFQVLSLYKGTPFFYADIVGEVFHSNVT